MAKEGFLPNKSALSAVQVSLFSENSIRWLLADQAVMMNGAIDAVSPPLQKSFCRSPLRCICKHFQPARLFHSDLLLHPHGISKWPATRVIRGKAVFWLCQHRPVTEALMETARPSRFQAAFLSSDLEAFMCVCR